MAERTLTVSSAGKIFSFTGWKVGWACGPADLVTAVRTAKQFLTFAGGGRSSTPSPSDSASATTSSPATPPRCRPNAIDSQPGSPTPALTSCRRRAPTSQVATSRRSARPTASTSVLRSGAAGVVAVPSMVFFDNRTRRLHYPLRVLQEGRGHRRGRRPTQGRPVVTLELAAIQHDIAWESPTDDRRRPATRARCSRAGRNLDLAHRDVGVRVLDEHRSRRRTPRRPHRDDHARAREETGCWIAGSFPSTPPATIDRPTASCSPGRTAKITGIPRPSHSRLPAKPTTTTAARRSNRSWSRVSRHPIHLLRPALHRPLLECGGGHRPLSRSGQLARRAS